MGSRLEKEFNYYLHHQEELVRKHPGKFVVIRDQAVQGVYDTELEALEQGTQRFPLGTFMVQRCEAGSDSYTHTFQSIVAV